MKGVRVIDKPTRGRYEDKDVHSKSSDIRVYSLYKQDWQTLVDEGLTHIFGDNESEFIKRKRERIDEIEKEHTETTQANEVAGDKAI